MKLIFSIALLFFALQSFAQSPAETAVLKLSANVFTWEVNNKLDSIDNVLDARFTAYISGGVRQAKEQYMATLKGGNVVHNSIIFEESSAIVVNNTATVGGKGKFTITINGTQKTIHLSYLEVFIRPGKNAPWKMLALHAGMLPN